METATAATAEYMWRFCRFGLIVTGEGERDGLPQFLRALTASGQCMFKVHGRIGQRSPIVSERRKLKMVGTGKILPERDVREIGMPARQFLQADERNFVLIIDDLEYARKAEAQAVFQRYREVLDKILGPLRHRSAVHFLVNMLEAYYFADCAAINAVLASDLSDFADDVETIRHPKSDLKRLCPGFDEVEHGVQIMSKLDMEHVLSRPETCGSLRVLFAWCTKAMGRPFTEQFQLAVGIYCPITKSQLMALEDIQSSSLGT